MDQEHHEQFPLDVEDERVFKTKAWIPSRRFFKTESRRGIKGHWLFMGFCVLLTGIIAVTLVHHSLWMSRELKTTQEYVRTLNISLTSNMAANRNGLQEKEEFAKLISHQQTSKENDFRQKFETFELLVRNSSTEEKDHYMKLHTELQALEEKVFEHLKQVRSSLDVLTTEIKILSRKEGSREGSAEPTADCPLNWQKFQKSCYYVSLIQKSWNDSRAFCFDMQSDLVVINNKRENDFIKQNNLMGAFWMGLAETDKDNWKWVDGTDYQTNFKLWDEGQPDNWKGHRLLGGSWL
ncbi:C-type lectin domain family 10 member A-like [Polypterus senegalus]|uniref:C-type lectin domain family 10 member A-like n=1 Tax=Polypterus senegalus TaxID=55291 RepID=UPI0019627B0C|nr:C-type lectin domain family 10 member A-like [Polypterus senegalus]